MPHHTPSQWAWAARPWSLPVSISPVLITLLYLWWSGRPVDWALGLVALLANVLLHCAGNTWSDWHDFRRGVDRADTPGARSLVDGVFTPRQIMALSLTLGFAGCLLGLGLVALTGLPLLWIGAAGVALTLAYPALKFRALGEAVIFLAFCVLPTLGTSWVASRTLAWDALLAVVPAAMVTTAVLFANNFRDIPSDAQARITTAPMHLSPRACGLVYAALVFGPYIWLCVCIAAGALPWAALISLASVPVAAACARYVWRAAAAPGADISLADERTAQLQLLLTILISAALAAAKIFF